MGESSITGRVKRSRGDPIREREREERERECHYRICIHEIIRILKQN